MATYKTSISPPRPRNRRERRALWRGCLQRFNFLRREQRTREERWLALQGSDPDQLNNS